MSHRAFVRFGFTLFAVGMVALLAGLASGPPGLTVALYSAQWCALGVLAVWTGRTVQKLEQRLGPPNDSAPA